MKFRCKTSGNVYEFNTELDIRSMKENPEYEEVKEEEAVSQTDTKQEGNPERKTLTLKKSAA